MKCLICNGESQAFCSVGENKIYKCTKCGFGQTLYPKYQKESYHRDDDYIAFSAQFKNIYSRRINLIDKYAKSEGKVLEIGSSTGLMLSLLKEKGWDVLGIELSPKSAKYANNKGITTIQNAFEKTKFNEKFDLVILSHTLEHLKNPEKILSRVNEILAKNGLLLIDLPNFGSYSAEHQKCKWEHLLIDEHLWHFTPESMRKILAKNGFKVLNISSPSGIWDYGNPFLELVQALFGLKKRFFKDLITALPSLVITFMNRGTSLTVIALKND